MRISPQATDEETAAIVAGMEALWPRTGLPGLIKKEQSTAWRFSGRWWDGPLPRDHQRS